MTARLGLIACAAMALSACGETKKRIDRVDLTLDLTVCLGDVAGKLPGGRDTVCRTRLDEQVVDAAVNVCLLIQQLDEGGGAVSYVPLRWSEGKLSTVGAGLPEINVAGGSKIKAEIYFHAEGFSESLCAAGGLAPGSECGANTACLLKLVEESLTISTDGSAVIDFQPESGGACVLQWTEGADMGSSGKGETCDGLDNDCDGQVDEDFPTLGDACSPGVGECKRTGNVACQNGVAECNVVPGDPVPEICDDLDNDCNGTPDDVAGCGGSACTRGQTRPCAEGAVGECRPGVNHCITEGEATKGTWDPACRIGGPESDPVPVAQPEICDGLDNNCDGQTDEGFNVGQGCNAGQGICAVAGDVVCLEDGTSACDATPGIPDIEICDGDDNDCDGATDENDAGDALTRPCYTGPAGTENVQPCRAGVETCREGRFGDCAGEIIPVPEICDGVDNNCSGEPDEDFAGLGGECVVGVGECLERGLTVCDPQNRQTTRCSADPGLPAAESCDNFDNDCDGSVDEGFDLASDANNCGVCGNVCELDHAIAECENRACMISACIGDFENLDGVDENGCECSRNSPDPPDLAFVDSNCDGVDGDAARAIFVSATHGSDDATGRIDDPLETIVRAVAIAEGRGFAIYLDAGTYSVGGSTLVVPSGVNIHGGFRYNPGDDTWGRAGRTLNRSMITGAASVLCYQGLQADTLLDNLVVISDDAGGSGRPTVAVMAVDVGEHLTLRTCTLQSRSGADGHDGTDGAAAARSALPGNPGFATDAACAGCGGDAGTNERCADGTPGGGGGAGARASGNDPSRSGCGGGTVTAADQCTAQLQSGTDLGGDGGGGGPSGASGTAGVSGEAGDNGTATEQGHPTGRIDPQTGLWLPSLSTDAGDGNPGGGGGGGGGGGARDNNAAGRGGGGGGGGGGGCAGRGGTGASGGGGSFALQIMGSLERDSVVYLVDCALQAGAGGVGGDGGRGGAGADGAPGGTGGATPGCATCGVGGDGGDGGRGGCGGHAGGGSGGPSYAILRVSPDQIPANRTRSRVQFLNLDGSLADQAAAAAEALRAGVAGDGGRGGLRQDCGDQAPNGQDGQIGSIGCCRRGPPSPICGDLSLCD